jgi:hypothetical protein
MVVPEVAKTTTVLRRIPDIWIREITDGKEWTSKVETVCLVVTVFARRARACHDRFGTGLTPPPIKHWAIVALSSS